MRASALLFRLAFHLKVPMLDFAQFVIRSGSRLDVQQAGQSDCRYRSTGSTGWSGLGDRQTTLSLLACCNLAGCLDRR